MSAETPTRRKMTAREGAARLGVSERHIRRLAAEPRAEFLARAAERRARAVELREKGLKIREIADEMGTSIGAVGRILRDARLLAEKSKASAAP